MQARLLQRFGLWLSVVLTACCLALSAQAQPEPIRYGQIEKADLTAAPFLGDSAASAVVLCDYGRSRMAGELDNLQVVFERVTRIKILKKAGYDAATVEIPLYHRDDKRERLSQLRGCTYNLVNGVVEKTELAPDGAFLEKRTANVDLRKFTLPNVREGAVVEFAYTLTSNYLFSFQDWTFQRSIPVRWSEYRVSIPLIYKYKIIYHGYQTLTVDKLSTGQTDLRSEQSMLGASINSMRVAASTEDHQWVLQDAPAFREEPYMTTADDYLARLDFQLVGVYWAGQPYRDLTDSWNKINYQLLTADNFGQQLDRGNFLKAQMRALATRHPDPAARAAAVREVVLGSVRYNGRNRYFTEESLRKAYNVHVGTSADVNLLLIAALRDAGLDAQPVLLSTRDHGRVSQEFPLLDKFNYVVALVPLAGGKDLLVDATEPLLPCGVLPERCLNGAGRLILPAKQGEGRWVPLVPTQRRVHLQQATLTLDAAGNLTGQVREQFSGYAGAEVRRRLAALGDKKFLAALVQQHDGWAVPYLTVTDRDSVAKPLALNYAFSRATGNATPVGTLSVSPLREFSGGLSPFRHESRLFPVDLGVPQDETTMVTLTLPAGYELVELPKSAIVNLPADGGRFAYSVAATGAQTVQLLSRLVLRKSIYDVAEYGQLRALYQALLKNQARQLLIRKKG